jgi:hypothetical protein
MYFVKRKRKGKPTDRIYYLIAETVYKDKKPRQKILQYLGTIENILVVFQNEKKGEKKIPIKNISRKNSY